MKQFITIICLAVLTLMLYVTISASLHQGIVSALYQLWPDPWFRATLADAYCGFLFFWLWVAWREPSLSASIVWFLLIMALGNIAMALYVLLQLRRLRPGDGIGSLFERRREIRS
jgi:hypothetical protein